MPLFCPAFSQLRFLGSMQSTATWEVNVYLRTIEPAEAEGEVAAIYANEVASMGRVMQATQCWSARPDILAPVEHGFLCRM